MDYDSLVEFVNGKAPKGWEVYTVSPSYDCSDVDVYFLKSEGDRLTWKEELTESERDDVKEFILKIGSAGEPTTIAAVDVY